MLLFEILDVFEKEKIGYILVGGYALALHDIVRATMDVDVVLNINLKEYEKAEKALNSIGLQSRIPVRAQDIIKMRKEYIEKRNLLAWSFVDYKNPSRMLDILINKDLKNFKPVKISVGGRKINVASLKDLLKMKQEAGRPQDLLDIEKIKEKLNEKK